MISNGLTSILNSIRSRMDELYPDIVSGYFLYNEAPDNLPLISTVEGQFPSKVLQDNVLPYIVLQLGQEINYAAYDYSGCSAVFKPMVNCKVLFVGSNKFKADAVESVLRFILGELDMNITHGSVDKFYIYKELMRSQNKTVENVNNILKNYSLVMLNFTTELEDSFDSCFPLPLCNGC